MTYIRFIGLIHRTLEDTIRALKDLLDMGKIRKIGVSNFSVRELKQAKDFLGEYSLFGNQVEYNLFDRSIEEEILPYCHQNDLTVMAYSPLDKGKVNYNNNKIEVLSKIAEKYQSSISQVVLNWLVTYSNVVVIPKAVNLDHVRLNAESLDFQLDSDDLIQIERAFDSTPIYVEPDKIRVSLEGEGNRNVYQTLQQALENPMGMSPSPSQLADFIRNGDSVKPVRLVRSKDTSGLYQYDLVEGRLRYWAWVIAFAGSKPVPAYTR